MGSQGEGRCLYQPLTVVFGAAAMNSTWMEQGEDMVSEKKGTVVEQGSPAFPCSLTAVRSASSPAGSEALPPQPCGQGGVRLALK